MVSRFSQASHQNKTLQLSNTIVEVTKTKSGSNRNKQQAETKERLLFW
jgi:hypothetical protein